MQDPYCKKHPKGRGDKTKLKLNSDSDTKVADNLAEVEKVNSQLHIALVLSIIFLGKAFAQNSFPQANTAPPPSMQNHPGTTTPSEPPMDPPMDDQVQPQQPQAQPPLQTQPQPNQMPSSQQQPQTQPQPTALQPNLEPPHVEVPVNTDGVIHKQEHRWQSDFELIGIKPYYKNKPRLGHLTAVLSSASNEVLGTVEADLGDCKDCIRGASVKSKIGIRLYGKDFKNLTVNRKQSSSIKIGNCPASGQALVNNLYVCEFSSGGNQLKLTLTLKP